MTRQPTTGYAPVNGLEIYWESRGTGETPLVVVHGGFGLTTMFGELLECWSAHRQVIALELQGHGHTRDIDRPLSYQACGDDIAAAIAHLGIARADLLGYSLGGGACLRAAMQHPDRVRRLALISTPFRRSGWFAEVLEQMGHVNRGAAAQMMQTPLYRAWREVAPDPGAFPTLMDKIGALLAQPYDWTDEVRGLRLPTLLVYADADSIPPSHAAEFFALMDGGVRDAGWDGSLRSDMRLAILPGRTHYDIVCAPELGPIVDAFVGRAGVG